MPTTPIMKLLLKCYFPAEPPFFTQIFAEGDHTVSWLVDEVLEELEKSGYDVQWNDLVLYKADVKIEPEADLTDRVIQWLRIQPQAAELCVMTVLDEVFTEALPRGTLHIIAANAEVKELFDHIGDPRARSRIRIRKKLGERFGELSSSPSPSAVVGSAEALEKFLNADGHPVCLDQIPAAMFSPPLAHLQRDLAELDHLEVTEHDVSHASSFLGGIIMFYHNENSRRDAIRRHVDSLIGEPGQWEQGLDRAGNTQPDASWWQGKFPVAILELKDAPGIGGDPFVQSIADYSKIVSDPQLACFQGSCNFPVLLLGLSGHRIEIGVAVCVGSIYASRLVAFDITPGFHLSENIIRVARIFKCLSSCRAALATHYRAVQGNRTTIAAIYPDPTSASSNALPRLTYHGVLLRTGEHVSTSLPDLGIGTTALYRATLGDDATPDGATEVIVKFASRYGEAAHRLLSDANLAPKLYWCGPIIGGLKMVVMEHLEDGESIWQLRDGSKPKPVPEAVLKDVKKALGLLHENGFVFGDLRDANVVSSKERGFLVDFDWAGKDGEDRYPAALNEGNKWHADVRAHAVMRKAHDMYQFEQLEAQLK